jgi:hypothetical protein
MDNGEQGKNKIIPHSVLMMGGMKRRAVFGQKNEKQKSMYIVVVLLCSFLSSINPSQVCFFFTKTNLQSTYTHKQSREHGVGRGSQEERKKRKQWFLFLPSHTN